MRLTALAIAALLLPASIPAAEAASFDCAKATTHIEKAVCANPALGKADEDLARAYAMALGKLSATGKVVLRETQRSWLRYAGLVCAPAAKPFIAALTHEQQICLLSTYARRTQDLDRFFEIHGPWRVYAKNTYRAVDDPDREQQTTFDLSSPRIDDDSPAAKSFNALMDEADASAIRKAETEDFSSTDISDETTIVSVASHRISLREDSWWYTHTAAHPNSATSYAHYLTDKQRLLTAEDLFAGQGWQAAVTTLASEELDRNFADSLYDNWRDDVAGPATNPKQWNLTRDGLEIVFQPYQVAPRVSGDVSVTISWDRLRPYLAPDSERILN